MSLNFNIIRRVICSLSAMLLLVASAPSWADNSCSIGLIVNHEFLPVLVEKILAAQKRVYIAHYIVNEDKAGHVVLNALLNAALRGVDVKLIYDGIGPGPNFPMVPTATRNILLAANIGVKVFGSIGSSALRLGYGISKRMHDKLVIVDDQVIVGSSGIWAASYHGLHEADALVRHEATTLAALEHFNMIWDSPRSKNFQLKNASAADLAALKVEGQSRAQEVRGFQMETHVAFQNQTSGCDIEYIHDGLKKNAPGSTLDKVFDRIDKSTTADIYNPYFLPTARLQKRILSTMGKSQFRIFTNTEATLGQEIPLLGMSYKTRYDFFKTSGLEVNEFDSDEMLHAKITVIDSHVIFLGSLNLDPLGIGKNTENGILFSIVPGSDFDLALQNYLSGIQNQSFQHFKDGHEQSQPEQIKMPKANFFLKLIRKLADPFL